MSAHPNRPREPTYHIMGLPLRTGSLYPGSENDAQAYRDVDLLGRLRTGGCTAFDDGDIAIPSYLHQGGGAGRRPEATCDPPEKGPRAGAASGARRRRLQ